MAEFIPRLDRRVRDVRQFQKKIDAIPIRVIVEGTRGKSTTVRILEEMMRGLGKRTFAKVTGEATPLIIYNGVVIPLYRQHHVVLLDYETIPTILNFDIDAIVLENQAVTPYTMRYVHKILKPQHVIIPNIRLDHNETLGSDLEEMVYNFIDNYRLATSRLDIYYAEPIQEVRKIVLPILEEFAQENPKKIVLHAVNIPERVKSIPCIENYVVDKYFIERTFGIPINEVDFVRPTGCVYSGCAINEDEYVKRLKNNLAVRTNSRSIRYANLAKINDPFSFLKIMQYLFRDTNDSIALFAYFRKDRAGRTELFESIFHDLEKMLGSRIKKIWFAGYAMRHAFAKLPESYQAITTFIKETEELESILTHVREHNLVLVTMVNSVNPLMIAMKQYLEEGQTENPLFPTGFEAPALETEHPLAPESQGTEGYVS